MKRIFALIVLVSFAGCSGVPHSKKGATGYVEATKLGLEPTEAQFVATMKNDTSRLETIPDDASIISPSGNSLTSQVKGLPVYNYTTVDHMSAVESAVRQAKSKGSSTIEYDVSDASFVKLMNYFPNQSSFVVKQGDIWIYMRFYWQT